MNLDIAKQGRAYIKKQYGKHPNHAGWDVLYMCTDVSDIMYDHMDCDTYLQLKEALKEIADVHAERYEDAQNSAF